MDACGLISNKDDDDDDDILRTSRLCEHVWTCTCVWQFREQVQKGMYKVLKDEYKTGMW